MRLKENERFFTERRLTDYRGNQFEYLHTCIIATNGEKWTPTQLDEANLNQILNQYRMKYGIPFPQEIIRLRKYYGLSASQMSVILGMNINQYRYYEDGEVPSVSNARTLIAIRDKNVFLELLKASYNTLMEEEYVKVFNYISRLPDFEKPENSLSPLNGYVCLSTNKLAAVMLYVSENLGGSTNVTKLNNILFYCDFLTYKTTGFGLTGLEYRAIQFGPVPNNWSRIYGDISEISMNECTTPNGEIVVKLQSEKKLIYPYSPTMR